VRANLERWLSCIHTSLFLPLLAIERKVVIAWLDPAIHPPPPIFAKTFAKKMDSLARGIRGVYAGLRRFAAAHFFLFGRGDKL